MKKFLTVLCMITCVFGLTACGAEKKDISFDKALLNATCQTLYDNICMDGSEELVAQLKGMDEVDLAGVENLFRQNGVKITGEAIIAGMESYNKAKTEVGEKGAIKDVKYVPDKDSVVATIVIEGTKHNADIEVIFDDKLSITNVSVNPHYTFGEQMERAALNTLLGMGTVFAVLILISCIIALLSYIPKIQEKLTNKNKTEEIKAEAVDHTIAQIIEKEEVSEDSELVAVIAAAIAASEGSTSTEGFVVRSIRRANTNKWQRA